VRFLPAGDTAVVVEFGDRIDRVLSDRVLQLAQRVRAAAFAGVTDIVPTFRSLLLEYDPLVTDGRSVAAAVRSLDAGADEAARRRRHWTIPASYAPEHAPDLVEVAERTGLTVDEVVALHAGTTFHVYMIGFAPGHPYLGDLPPALALPRRANPRLRVPAGSIAIAMTLSVVHPVDNPSGWHVIGATPVRLFDPACAQPALLAPGDVVSFRPVGVEEYEAVRSAVAANSYAPMCEEFSP
jgi:KipI family sensor histidine kinase inhibitor